MICEVTLNEQDCETARGMGSIRTRCYRCGSAACRECSAMVYCLHTRRRIRMCNDCRESEGYTPPLYHGTRAGFGRGGVILPQALHGAERRPGSDDEGAEFAYATTDREMAEFYAENTRGRGAPKVLTVLPFGRLEPDRSTYDFEQGHQVRSRHGFRVVAVERIAS